MYAIIRQEKIKSADSFNGRLHHNQRDYFSKNINRELTHKNITLTQSSYKNLDEFAELKKKEIQEHNKEFGTKNRMVRQVLNKKTGQKEYQALSQEFVITHSHKAMSEEESIEYLKRADKFLREWFGNCEVIQSVIHLDEKTPHLHFIVSYFDKEEKRFKQKELSKAGKTDINIIREAFQEEVAKGYGLLKQDGSVVVEHERKADIEKAELKEWKKELEAELEEANEALYIETSKSIELERQVQKLKNELKKLKEAYAKGELYQREKNQNTGKYKAIFDEMVKKGKKKHRNR
jgi:hypothetical protein